MPRHILICVVVYVSLGWASTTRAVDYFWTGPGLGGPGGNFQNSSNWTFTPPPFPLDPAPGGANDTVNFDLGRAPENRYNVTNVHGENDRLIVHDDSLTLVVPDINVGSAIDYVLSNASTTSPSLTVGVALADVADLTLQGGGGRAVVSTQTTTIGRAAFSTGRLTVTDELRLLGSGDLMIGESGFGTLTIQNGAVVASDDGLLGVNEGLGFSGSGTVIVTGAESTWNMQDGLGVGIEGVGELTIEAGGRVSNVTGSIGLSVAGATGEVLVTGVGSVWTNSHLLQIGVFGSGTLTIADGGTVTNTSSNLAFNVGSSATVTVTGVGSQWTNSEDLDVGLRDEAVLTISDGGSVSNAIGRIGINAEGVGTVTVMGAGSTWGNSSELRVGDLGEGTLVILDGGSVASANGVIGRADDSTGDATITGTDSTWTNLSLTVAESGRGELTVSAGGVVVSSVNGVVGAELGSTANVIVRDPNSAWNIGNDLTMGLGGAGFLNVQNGGTVTSDAGFIGREAGSFGNALVTGAQSIWAMTERLSIGGDAPAGTSGGSGTLIINLGGMVDVTQDTVVFPNGLIRLQTGGTLATTAINFEGGGQFQWTGGTLHVGVFEGNLTNPSGGTLAPGRSAGSTTILGNYSQLAGGTLEIEIGGTATATEFDFVQVTGTATLGGELELALINGFVPDPDDEFILFNADVDLVNFFSNAGNGERVFTVNGDGSFLVHYGPTSAFDPDQIVLTDFLPVLLGDYNDDGAVDAADYTVWRDNLGTNFDLNGNGDESGASAGVVDDADYTWWKQRYGNVLQHGGGALNHAPASVPEPCLLVLVMASLLAILSRRFALLAASN